MSNPHVESNTWRVITPSPFAHERRALDFIAAAFPNHDPYRAWANFEFTAADGALYEVDLLVLTKEGFWLVEIKSRPGKLEGDAGTWTWTTPEGRRVTDDNPVHLANRKAKALKDLILSQPAVKGIRVPYLEPVIFLSAPDLDVQLSQPGRNRVCPVDRPAEDPRGPRDGILAGLMSRRVPGVEPYCRTDIDAKVARCLTKAVDQAGVRRSVKERRAGDYFLGELVADGPGYQDRVATHGALKGVTRRARQYLVARAASEDQRPHIQRAAEREFRLLHGLEHPNVLRVHDFKVHEFGPVLLFEHDPAAVRLDHFLASRADRLTPGLRLALLRQLADAIRHAHGRRVIHRALSPQSVLVFDPDGSAPCPKLFNWQVGVRDSETATSGTTHVQDLVDNQSLVFLAPEALFSPRHVTQAADVFSLGAIAYQLFAGRPPAASAVELTNLLREHKGLDLSAVLDGAGPKLCEMIRWATHPEVGSRLDSAEGFLAWLDEVEEELTAPEGTAAVDPLLARRGDELAGGYRVERILGQGATGLALLAERGGEQVVLKVARTADDNARLRDEGDVLRALRSEYIVGLREVIEIGERTVLVLDKAGDETLSDRLRQEGRCSLDLLERFGEDLLSAVAKLEDEGVAHRDIKPHNIAVRSGKQRLQLVLFDFSLSRAPADNVFVGTAPYLDPFLRGRTPAQWEPSAERYAAAVTLYEMAQGPDKFPKWGDGSDPAAVPDARLQLDTEAFDQEVRAGLDKFFRKALHREIKSRFHNADEMLRAWRDVFRQAERRPGRAGEADETPAEIDWDEVRLDTSVESLGLSTRARNALARVNVTNARELLTYPAGDFTVMRGVGNKTRREILRRVGRLRELFPDISAPPPAPSPGEDVTLLGLSALRERLIGSAPVSGKKAGERRIRLALLGLEPPADGWPSQSEVSEYLKLSRQRVSQVLLPDRKRWNRDPAVSAVREQVVQHVGRAGGVAAGRELVEFLLAGRGFDYADPGHAPRLASALLRIAFEAEQAAADPRLHLTRTPTRFVLACSPELAEYAVRLGRSADTIATEDPLPSADRALQRLYDVQPPEIPAGCAPFNSDRLRKLAVAVGAKAALSTRLEIYPKEMAAARALRLGIGALTGLAPGDGIRLEDVRQKITARYPEALPLPGRPELDALLKEVGLDLFWDEQSECYRRPGAALPLSTGPSLVPSRLATTSPSRRPSGSPEAAEAEDFEERLRNALAHRQFLVLTVRPSWMTRCEAELVRRFSLRRVSLDAVLLRHLRRLAGNEGIEWPVVLEADAERGTEDWQYLQILVNRAVPLVRDELLAIPEPVLLVNPGLLARYNQMGLLEHLRDRVGRADVCPGMWVLVPGDDQQKLPLIDGRAVPILGAGQHAAVPLSWFRNEHRGVAAAS